jgi:two-component system KDP operon response regulator KdpE
LYYPDADSDGIRACAMLREWNPVPVIIISARSDEHLKVQALDAGADDFLVKPFGVQELMARVRAILRRVASPADKEATPESPTPLIKIKDLISDLDYRSVWQGGKPLHLTHKEFALFRLLGQAHGGLVTYGKIVSEVWGKPANAVERMAARALFKHLRRRLGEDSANPIYLLTEPGVGYRLNVPLS